MFWSQAPDLSYKPKPLVSATKDHVSTSVIFCIFFWADSVWHRLGLGHRSSGAMSLLDSAISFYSRPQWPSCAVRKWFSRDHCCQNRSQVVGLCMCQPSSIRPRTFDVNWFIKNCVATVASWMCGIVLDYWMDSSAEGTVVREMAFIPCGSAWLCSEVTTKCFCCFLFTVGRISTPLLHATLSLRSTGACQPCKSFHLLHFVLACHTLAFFTKHLVICTVLSWRLPGISEHVMARFFYIHTVAWQWQ